MTNKTERLGGSDKEVTLDLRPAGEETHEWGCREGPQAEKTEGQEPGGVDTAQDGGQCGGHGELSLGRTLKSQPEPELMGVWRPGQRVRFYPEGNGKVINRQGDNPTCT